MYKQNLHMHTTWCDGKNTPAEMVEAAIAQGFDSIGFSAHSYMTYGNPGSSLTPEDTEGYCREIHRLQQQYAGQLDIFCGIEYDMFSNISLEPFEYAIGSMHYFDIDGQYVAFDRPLDLVRQVIDTHFGGDGMAFAKKYYEEIIHLPEYGKFDILGHFDLVTKHIENARFFDPDSKEYLGYALQAAEALRPHIPIFEVNTGAIARGNRTSPYPSLAIMRGMKELGFGATISSDCHDAQQMSCHYEQAAEMLKACGFTEIQILTKDGFVPSAL